MFTKLWNWIKSWFKKEEKTVWNIYSEIEAWVMLKEKLVEKAFVDEAKLIEAKIKELVAKL